MSVTDEVFLVLLKDKLERIRGQNSTLTYTDIALIALDGTAEIMSVVGKMSKSSVKNSEESI